MLDQNCLKQISIKTTFVILFRIVLEQFGVIVTISFDKRLTFLKDIDIYIYIYIYMIPTKLTQDIFES